MISIEIKNYGGSLTSRWVTTKVWYPSMFGVSHLMRANIKQPVTKIKWGMFTNHLRKAYESI